MHMLSQFPGTQQHFNVTNDKLVCCYRGKSIFSDKINLKKVSEPFTSTWYTRHFVRRHIFPQTLFTHCIHLSTPLNISAREHLSRQWEHSFLNNEIPKKTFILAPSSETLGVVSGGGIKKIRQICSVKSYK